MKKFFLIFMCLSFLVGCSKQDDNDMIVTYLEAKEKIINEKAILIDVRTEDEYNESHIDGAVLFTLNTIDENTVTDVISSKEDVVIVYCRSGNRSAQALEKLNSLGYKNVYDLGAMSNWEE